MRKSREKKKLGELRRAASGLRQVNQPSQEHIVIDREVKEEFIIDDSDEDDGNILYTGT